MPRNPRQQVARPDPDATSEKEKMMWRDPFVLAIAFGIVLAVIVGVQLSGVWNCC
jgi:hypothetical protein